MSSGDWQAFLILMAISFVLPGASAGMLARFRAGWTRRRIALFSAAPLPALIALFCAFVIASVLMTPKEQCGVDACAMAFAFSLIIMMWAVLAYCIGLISAWLVCGRVKK